MSAELLREAASLMRARAEAVTSGGQWTGEHYWVTDYDQSDPSGQTAMQRLIGGMDSPDCDHYAGMDPTVALAVADLLDESARSTETFGTIGQPGSLNHCCFEVARAYLGAVVMTLSEPQIEAQRCKVHGGYHFHADAVEALIGEATQQARAEALARVEEWFSDIDLDDLRASYREGL